MGVWGGNCAAAAPGRYPALLAGRDDVPDMRGFNFAGLMKPSAQIGYQIWRGACGCCDGHVVNVTDGSVPRHGRKFLEERFYKDALASWS